MADSAYSLTLPSLEDDTQLDCRLYHPKQLQAVLSDPTTEARLKGAIVAHPYAPLGGCYDDHVVLSITETLVEEGLVVATFNFRGAGESAGRTSWTGNGERNDYMSLVGFLVSYLEKLRTTSPTAEELRLSEINLILAGYSYGSLVLAQLPSIKTILQRLENPVAGTAEAEIILRATKLASETKHHLEIDHSPASPRGRQLRPEDAAATSLGRRTGVSPITVGGEETDPSTRRRSRDSRRSTDLIRKSMDAVHIGRKRRSENIQKPEKTNSSSTASSGGDGSRPDIATHYLLISPVILPLTNSLCPPGPPSVGLGSLSIRTQSNSAAGSQFLSHPTLVVFGSKDVFTSSKRLRSWSEKQVKLSHSRFEWAEIEGAGHFWSEEGAMEGLLEMVKGWIESG